jgi:hypothetical protein
MVMDKVIEANRVTIHKEMNVPINQTHYVTLNGRELTPEEWKEYAAMTMDERFKKYGNSITEQLEERK